ncbi:MAG: pantoate--beta-alanine ligase [Kangiellaceae bacterium]|nr:pantoate--beta-alanine ligase [Kangiellaceae bacterium]
MKIFSSPTELQSHIVNLKKQGKSVAFVPTMGNLHQGHLSLVELAKQKADIVVCSIFVNPTQFGPNEDFDSYPRTLEQDTKKLEQVGNQILFTPTNNDIYPQGKEVHSSVEVNRLTDKLCGASRPGHFRGVTTIVNILFNIVQPDVAIFGKKDYQQYLVIRAMVKDLMMPIKIIGAEIAREPNGLAMSSRNGFLAEQEKKQSSYLREVILLSQKQLEDPKKDINEVKLQACKLLQNKGFKVDYFEIVERNTLELATSNDNELLIAAAAWLGKPRLIDNLEVNLN